MMTEPNAELYAEQMAEVENVDAILAGLSAELNRTRATVRGYREAREIRDSMCMWEDMRARMLAFAASVKPETVS